MRTEKHNKLLYHFENLLEFFGIVSPVKYQKPLQKWYSLLANKTLLRNYRIRCLIRKKNYVFFANQWYNQKLRQLFQNNKIIKKKLLRKFLKSRQATGEWLTQEIWNFYLMHKRLLLKHSYLYEHA